MSPRSRGRPSGRGRRQRPVRRSGRNGGGPRRVVSSPAVDASAPRVGATSDCWFDEPVADERSSWAMPAGHGSYRGLDLELLDAADEDELALLIEAQHPELADALRSDEEITVGGEPFSPRLHIAMHQIVASQLLADDPSETWQTVRRLAGLGYDWHNIMHMIAAVITADLYAATTEQRPFDARDYVRRLHELPGDWPPPPA
jgi:hypothetical protein